jgi:hypothetical protein
MDVRPLFRSVEVPSGGDVREINLKSLEASQPEKWHDHRQTVSQLVRKQQNSNMNESYSREMPVALISRRSKEKDIFFPEKNPAVFPWEDGEEEPVPIPPKAKKRAAFCLKDYCDDLLCPCTKKTTTTTLKPLDCVWEQWQDWSRCSESCGGGDKERKRGFKQSATAGGRQCEGPGMESTSCNIAPCPKPTTTGAPEQTKAVEQATEEEKEEEKKPSKIIPVLIIGGSILGVAILLSIAYCMRGGDTTAQDIAFSQSMPQKSIPFQTSYDEDDYDVRSMSSYDARRMETDIGFAETKSLCKF